MNYGFLKDDEMITEIEKYLDEDYYNSALMIDGSWGSGKTYFVNNKLCDWLNTNNKKYIYVSLYGIKKIEDIENELYSRNMFKEEHLSKKVALFKGSTSLLFSVISNKLKDKGVDLQKEEAIQTLLPFVKIDEDITFIFDDVERCEIPINELFGYINTFVEHQSRKVILVANEQEIIIKSYKNTEWKYLVALQSLKHNKNDENKKDEEFVSDMDIKNRAETLFDNESSYTKIKEKLIGKTLHYKPKLSEVFKHLISTQLVDDDIKLYFRNNLTNIVENFEKNEHYNIRTFQFILERFCNIFEHIKDENEDYIQMLLNLMAIVSVDLKQGKNTKRNNTYNMSMLHNYLTTSVWDDLLFKMAQKEYQRENIKNEVSNNYNVIKYWSRHKEKELHKAIEVLENNFYKLDVSEFAPLLFYFVEFSIQGILTKEKFSSLINGIVDSFENRIFKDEEWYHSASLQAAMIDESKEHKDLYVDSANQIREAIIAKKHSSLTLWELTPKNNEDLFGVNVKKNTPMLYNGTISDLCNELIHSSPEKIGNFRYVISSYLKKSDRLDYVTDSYINDLVMLKNQIMDNLDRIDDKVVQIQLTWLNELIEDILTLYKETKEL